MEALRRFFRLFDEGAVFKWIVVCLFVLQALMLLAYNLRDAYRLLRGLGDARFVEGLAAVILVLALLLGTLLAVIILAYRGVYEVAKRQAERYSLLFLLAKVLRVGGECALFYLLVLAPAGCLAVWLSEGQLVGFVPFARVLASSTTFFLGVAVLLRGVLYAFVFVFLAYVLAEICELLPAVATNVAAIRNAKTSPR